ncbi:c-type cytochrome biogenesis protein CcmI [Profundibacterium mesophilum]|uniref:CycH protein n=1 Tax=Profundibacterium mesophilum KAUST100406-0324 TaxID=1037889 RepID=A0A921NW12_9RHOB|nr:c-type cytochrome biogenesis protein CcmI [Profundibacterium mesophilum]KAF0676698.1 CycH protein [Profundibacterium mesophilum KAUST100406-0324]
MTFWLVAFAIAATVAGIVTMVLLRSERSASAGAQSVSVYRDQLEEIERDLERGTIAETEAARLRTEISRRLIEADRRAGADRTSPAPRAASAIAAAVTVLVILAGGGALYLSTGAPGYPDLPLAHRIALVEQARTERPRQPDAEEAALSSLPRAQEVDPAFLELMRKLRGAVAERPDDQQGYQLLARNEARLGNFGAAAQAQMQLVQLRGAEASATEITQAAEFLILAAGGYVSPEAETALDAALARDPSNGRARYLKGLTHAQVGRPDLAFGLWRQLLEDSPPDAPWLPPIREQIVELAQLAGVRYDPPEGSALPGPDAAQIAAAEDMSDEDRQQMIRSMVAGLSDRLITEGGTRAEWERLFGALSVLGDSAGIDAAWEAAQLNFAGTAQDRAAVEAAARAAGASGAGADTQ